MVSPSRPQQTATRAPLGLMGGTFDPVHHGHLRLAEEAAERFGLAQVRWIPSGSPGHRGAPRTPSRQRLEMVRLAVQDNPRFVVDDAEALGDTPRFTIDTLRRLRAELGAALPLVLIIGADQLHRLDTWRAWRELFDLAHFAVAERPGYTLAPAALPAAVAAEWQRRGAAPEALRATPSGRMSAFPSTSLAISASDIRRRLAAGASARYLLPPEVLAYIRTHRLYSEDTKQLMDIRKKSQTVVAALEDIKARDITAFNVTHLTSLFDRVIIATADSARQAKALAVHLHEKLKARGERVYGVEGESGGDWVLIDLGDVVVHIMQPAVRQYYNLEELWGEPRPRAKRTRPKPKTAEPVL